MSEPLRHSLGWGTKLSKNPCPLAKSGDIAVLSPDRITCPECKKKALANDADMPIVTPTSQAYRIDNITMIKNEAPNEESKEPTLEEICKSPKGTFQYKPADAPWWVDFDPAEDCAPQLLLTYRFRRKKLGQLGSMVDLFVGNSPEGRGLLFEFGSKIIDEVIKDINIRLGLAGHINEFDHLFVQTKRYMLGPQK
ncbi:MAG TPA: hypothetical protein VHD33_03475 [Legionellaceae bacterium]|nr:hypothetical protein [Legionellaceae bacterium]